MNRCHFALILAGVLAACGGQTQAPAERATQAAPAVPTPPDESRRFPAEGRVKVDLIDVNLLGKPHRPGGNLAAYARNGKQFRLFRAVGASPDAAAFPMLDFNNVLAVAKYVIHMGGYFGRDGEEPVFVLQKGKYLAGVVGLDEKEADLTARELASRLD
jgi:hypothetical protein